MPKKIKTNRRGPATTLGALTFRTLWAFSGLPLELTVRGAIHLARERREWDRRWAARPPVEPPYPPPPPPSFGEPPPSGEPF